VNTPLLAAALSLLCAWSQPHCGAASRIELHQGPTPNDVAGLYYTQRREIVIDTQVQHPMVVAVLLAHELQHALDGSFKPGGCANFEERGYQAQERAAAWLISTFGPPVLDRAEDQRVWSDINVPVWWHVALSCAFDVNATAQMSSK
jgi:hypothetical protein